MHRHARRRVAQAARQQELEARLRQIEAGLAEWEAWVQWTSLAEQVQHGQTPPRRPSLFPESLQALRLLLLEDLDRLQRRS